MKKIKLFFCLLFCVFFISFYFIKTNNFSYGYFYDTTRNYDFTYNLKHYIFSSKDFSFNDNYKINNIKTQEDYINLFNKINNFGLTEKEIVTYLFPEVEIIKNKLCNIINIESKDDYVEYEKNSCKINIINGYDGIYLDQDNFYENIYKNVKNNNFNIKLNIITKKYKKNNIEDFYQEKSSFSTNFASSSDSRKNNIKVALEAFDGIILDEGETMSFNDVTGNRNKENGYMEAKIISNGTFVDGFGGGVCQVSTTIYNACLLAGLDILEVHNHSLPVSYIEPSFDAMVNAGSSDLVIRNNTNGKIIFTTSSKNNICKVKIYGLKNKYKITRYSEKVKIIPAESDIIITDDKFFGDNELEIGESKRLSYAKDGYISNGFLKYFDENGILVETKKIRENTYNSTKGIILYREK